MVWGPPIGASETASSIKAKVEGAADVNKLAASALQAAAGIEKTKISSTGTWPGAEVAGGRDYFFIHPWALFEKITVLQSSWSCTGYIANANGSHMLQGGNLMLNSDFFTFTYYLPAGTYRVVVITANNVNAGTVYLKDGTTTIVNNIAGSATRNAATGISIAEGEHTFHMGSSAGISNGNFGVSAIIFIRTGA